ncbi:MAG TPA: NUDIX domain-containing protein [Draconibacterium sp.]|nr:NUDIX domain-containing protein [Draconibacterium sp.]
MLKVTCACIVKEGRILVTQRGADTYHPFLWEFPGGKIKPDETPEACIKREIREELELEIKILKPMVSVQHNYQTKQIELIPFLCSTNSEKLKLNEHVDFKWVEWNELFELPFSEADEKLIQQVANREILKEYFGKETDKTGQNTGPANN